VIHADQTGDVDRCVDLLHALARRRAGRSLVVIDEPTRQAPQTVAGLDGTPSEQDTTVDLDHDRGRYLRVVPQNEVVARAGFDIATFDDPRHELSPAVDAEVAHRRRDYAGFSLCCLAEVAFMSATRTWSRPPCFAA
jgi:hypothetical protein